MTSTNSTSKVLPFRRDEAPDRLFDTSNEALAPRFGERARLAIRAGDPDVAWWFARLAASYAARVLLAQSLPDVIDAHLRALGLVYVGQSEVIQ